MVFSKKVTEYDFKFFYGKDVLSLIYLQKKTSIFSYFFNKNTFGIIIHSEIATAFAVVIQNF